MSLNPVIDPDDVDDTFEQWHRDAMLDLILAWGSLDGALGMLVARVLNVPLDEGAEIIGKTSGSARLDTVRRVLREAPGGIDAARMMKRHKKNYERHSFIRNRIAHAHCAGVWRRDRNFVLFAAFEKVGDGALAFDAIPIDEMQRATRWGWAMRNLAIKLTQAI